MKYRELEVEGFLKNFIHSFWEYETGDEAVEHTIIPDGYFDLIAEFECDTLQRIKLTGVWAKPVHVVICASTTLFAIRFKLLAAEYLFQREMKSILNSTQHLPLDFWNINGYTRGDFGKFVHDTVGRLEHSLKHLREIDSRKLRLFELAYTNPSLGVEQLAAGVYWSSRQINRYLNCRFGFPLKTFLSIVRCNAAYTGIANGDLAPGDSFFDQAHFIKEIKKHTGATPGELAENENVRFLQLATRA